MTETYSGKNFIRVFYTAIADWREGGCVGPDPMENWQWSSQNGKWVNSLGTPSFVQPDTFYRWKPDSKSQITIGFKSKRTGQWINQTLVAPETIMPPHGCEYWLLTYNGVCRQLSNGAAIGRSWLKDRRVFLTQADANAMQEWLWVCRCSQEPA